MAASGRFLPQNSLPLAAIPINPAHATSASDSRARPIPRLGMRFSEFHGPSKSPFFTGRPSASRQRLENPENPAPDGGVQASRVIKVVLPPAAVVFTLTTRSASMRWRG